MVIDIILLIIGITGLVAASIFDIKTKEVPDWISYSMIFSGIFIRLLFSVKTFIFSYFFIGLLGFFIMLILGNLMYYTKQWGGGDTKIMMGLGAIFATLPDQKFFLMSLVINLLIVGAIYGIIWSIVLAIKNKDKFKKEVKKRISENKKINIMILFLLIILFGNLFLINDKTVRIVVLSISVLIGVYYYLLIIIKAIEDSSMYIVVPVSKLTEGDWVANNIKLNHKLIYKKSSLGLTKDQLQIIKHSKLRKVKIKEGIPFIPSIFIATLVTLIFGNIIQSII
ncbi:prepilin peptidase [Candidatus Woesearchaeota archaeon]|nr:prepilin peptidase [Candidatus Woesearchaeota archaeon]